MKYVSIKVFHMATRRNISIILILSGTGYNWLSINDNFLDFGTNFAP